MYILSKLTWSVYVCDLGVYEGWEGEAFPCIRVQKSPDPQNPDGIPRWVRECMCVWDYALSTIQYNSLVG